MARKISLSQLRSKVRQAQSKQKRAIDAYNREVRRYNSTAKAAIDKYNREVRAYNARVRANRSRIISELKRLSRTSSGTSYVSLRTTVQTLHKSYVRLEEEATRQSFGDNYNCLLDLSEKETAESLSAFNAISNDDPDTEQDSRELEGTAIKDELKKISPDLDARWQGAIFSLSPKNPDAARHFCTSAREIFTEILELKAPDSAVFSAFPDCEKTQQGKPTRRSKIKYFLLQKGLPAESLEQFVDADIEDVLELFRTFNSATHGAAGKYSFHMLSAVKKRVESGILYLTNLAIP